MVHSDLDKDGEHQGLVLGTFKVDTFNDRIHVSLEVFKSIDLRGSRID
jgi:hypothetical protein